MNKSEFYPADKIQWTVRLCIKITAFLFSTIYFSSPSILTASTRKAVTHFATFSPVSIPVGKTFEGGGSEIPIKGRDLTVTAENTLIFSPNAVRRIRVSDDRRHLEYEDGSPFFYLGDTAWELFQRLNREEADYYLENRANKGFTVIQAAAWAELDGNRTPNAYGQYALHNNDPATPNDAYFDHVDYIVNKAESLGLYVGMLPSWGDKIGKRPNEGNSGYFTPENARIYGAWIANRYKNKPVIWILGGDRAIETGNQYAIVRALAEGIRSVVGNSQLITFHAPGPKPDRHTEVDRGSSTYFHHDSWLDFNMFQSGHRTYNITNYKWVAHDRSLYPVKPTLDGEPRYEDHPVGWNLLTGRFNDFDVRQAAYWAVIAGAAGHTYGNHNIWQMHQPGRRPGIWSPSTSWRQALSHAGATHMGFMKALFLSRPWLELNPDQSLIASGQGHGGSYVVAAKGNDYAFVYIPTGENVTVYLGKFSGNTVKAWWFNPRNREVTDLGTFPNEGSRSFDAPGGNGRGNDWVLVLDDASKNYPAPGHGKVVAENPPQNPPLPTHPPQKPEPKPSVPAPTDGFSGYYRLVARHSGKVLDVNGASQSDGANIHQWVLNGGKNQIWQIVSTGDGYYKILASHSGKALEVEGAGTQSGANVQQWYDNGSESQRWAVEPVGDGYYKLISKVGNKALDVLYGSSENGANAIQWPYHGAVNQQWKLEKVSDGKSNLENSLEGLYTASLTPNPASTDVSLKVSWREADNLRIVISNAAGVEFYHKVHSVEAGENTFTISVRHMPPGMYFINVHSKLSEKLIISR